jgi:MOSC domain-containing protein YiiM
MITIGKVVSINYSDKKGVLKKPVDYGEFQANYGMVGDAHAGVPIRQVSLLGKESIVKMETQLGKELPHGSFAENITTKGIEWFTLPVGTRFQIGETIQALSQIGKKCHTGCAIGQQVGKCIMPLEGVFTVVIQGGTIRVGDDIKIL